MTLIRLKASLYSFGLFSCVTIGVLTTGCAHFRSSGVASSEKTDEVAVKTPEQIRIETLESQISQLQLKLEKVESDLQTTNQKQRPGQVSIQKMGNGIVESTELVQSSVALSDPEKGFIQDSSILSLRQSKVLFDSEKYPEAILGFSTFVEKNANHPLASQAQYYLADSYFRQNDYPIAEKEFRRLVRNYPQSPLISRARERLRACAEKTVPPNQKRDAPTSPPASIPNSNSHPPTSENLGSSQSGAVRNMSDLDLAPIEVSPSGNLE